MKNLVIMTAACAALFAASATVNAADVEKGKEKSTMCVACHGVDGNSIAPTFPNLAGQHAAYLAKAIKDYRDGRRTDPSMNPMVKSLTDDDVANLAAYFSAQKPKACK